VRGTATVKEYLDFNLEIGMGVETGIGGLQDYPVAVNSPGGQASELMHFSFDEWELRDKQRELEIAVLRSGPCRRGFPPFNARGSPRRTRRRSPWLTSRGWRTPISWWRWTPSPSCLCEPSRGSRPRRARSDLRSGLSPRPRGRVTSSAEAIPDAPSSGRNPPASGS
jgi:hypothetical protein